MRKELLVKQDLDDEQDAGRDCEIDVLRKASLYTIMDRAMIAMAKNIPQPNKVAFQKFSLNAFRKSCQRKRGSSSTI